MGLKTYLSKRNLKHTHEPASTRKPQPSNSLRFCVQKHAARRLHYDFRLECRGVLLSWAVPKGPSLNPNDKRLAIHVEDHPLDYQYFEGVIPRGNYGAGTVEIWDSGVFTVVGTNSREEAEKILTQGLHKGHFAIILQGEKLRGEFVFQKLKKDPDDTAWLLIKKKDDFASTKQKDYLEDPSPVKKPTRKTKMPDFIPPMLATLVEKPFNSEDWLFEIKWDGFRALAFIDHGDVKLKSRSNHLLNSNFPAIIDQLKKIDSSTIFDGEVVVLDEKGKSHFQLIQNYQKDRQGHLFYYVFDLLYKDGKDLRELPLIERKEILKKYLKDLSLPSIRYSDHVVENGEGFFKEAAKQQLEGIVGKQIVSSYQSKRSRDWVKIKTALRQEFVIGGFTAPRGSRKKFGALLVGYYDDNHKLHYAGHVGGGFDAALLEQVHEQLKKLVQSKSPFTKEPQVNESVTWVKPRLVCEVSFAEWTNDKVLRQPIFQGLREDKNPLEVKKEMPVKPSSDNSSKKSKTKKTQELSLTNLDKIYWPEEKYTKGDLIAYYEKIAPFILPYLKDRPIMLHRYPNGIEGKDFYQKDIDSAHPKWIKTFPVQHEGKIINYLLISDLKSLLYAINLGSIDVHPFMSRCKKLDNPDYCVIDLDPREVPFKQVIETALATHEFLEQIDVPHYCKTSGGKGLHLLIPLHGKYSFEQSRQFAEIIAHHVHEQLPGITSLERDPKKREKRIYLDCLQNRFGQTIVAPYAVRPRPHALASTPLSWDEVDKNLDPAVFNMKTVPGRLKAIGDIFTPVLGKEINLEKVLSCLSLDK